MKSERDEEIERYIREKLAPLNESFKRKLPEILEKLILFGEVKIGIKNKALK